MAPSWLTARPVAHRGYHNIGAGRIENTLTAVRAAVERDFAIEVDVQLTGDGEAVVHHDESLGRLTQGSGKLIDMTTDAIRAIRFKASDDHIPTLTELFDTVAGRVPLVIEIKSTFPRPGDDRLAARTVELTKAYSGPAALMSFDPEVVKAVRRLGPNIPRGIVADDATDMEHYGKLTALDRFSLRHLLHGFSSQPDFVAYHVDSLPAIGPTVARKIFGRPLLTWTVRRPEQRRIAEAHADQMIFEGFDPEA